IAKAVSHRHMPAGRALAICGAGGAALLILVTASSTLSRMAPAACFGSLLVMTAPVAARGRRTLAISAALLAISALLVFFLVPPELINRYSSRLVEGRSALWRDTLPLVRIFPLLGCGLGGYRSVFNQTKASFFLFDVDYAHNDYLQLLVELG